MKFYNRNNNYDFNEQDFLFEIKDFCVDLGEPFSYQGKVYSACAISLTENKAIVEELHIDLHNDECFMADLITCPICGYKDADSWEISPIETEYDCPNCGAVLELEVEHTVTYTTNVKEKPTIKVVKEN